MIVPPPRLHDIDWSENQVFEVDDDPDRCQYPFEPKFLTFKNPKEQCEAVDVEQVLLTREYSLNGGEPFAKILHNVLTPKECAELIELVNHKGFTPALLNIGRGRQQLRSDVRDGLRCIVDTPSFASYLFSIIQPFLPDRVKLLGHEETHLEGLNERCRFLVYKPGHFFAPHCDGCYTRPNGDCSRVTVQLYLHDVNPAAGGATNFINVKGEKVACQPRCGSALVFSQDLYHEGALVTEGFKYTMRTEAMYTHDPSRTARNSQERANGSLDAEEGGRDGELDLT